MSFCGNAPMVHVWPSGFRAAVLRRPSSREQGVPCGTGSVGSPQLFRYASAAAWIASRVSRLSLGISSHFSLRVVARCSVAPNYQSPASVTTDSIFDAFPSSVASMRVWMTYGCGSVAATNSVNVAHCFVS